MNAMHYTAEDCGHSPFLVFYEATRACDLACQHCRACAQTRPHANELKHEQSLALIDELACFPHKPLLVFTGGDPLKRDDIVDLVTYAADQGLTVALTPAATKLATLKMLGRLRDAGLHRLALSLDSCDASVHDGIRGVKGSYDQTLRIMADARQVGLSLQINTTICRQNVHQVNAMAKLLAEEQIVLWSVFFLVPVGRGLKVGRISPPQYERVFEQLWQHARRQPYGIKTTEAPFYRRYVLMREGDPQTGPQRAPLGINDGKGVMFVSHVGQVFPSGFLPIDCGRFPQQSVVDIYQKHKVFRELRQSDLLKGKCGVCKFRDVCGGSRARSYAVEGDYLAAEPDCMHMPPAWRERQGFSPNGYEDRTCSV